MPKLPSIWVDAATLHFVDQAGEEYFYTGDIVSTPVGATPGSLWIDGNYLHYIDATGVDRQVPNIHISSPAGALAGSLWAIISKLHWIAQAGAEEREGHNDITHIDTHGDVGHAYSSCRFTYR